MAEIINPRTLLLMKTYRIGKYEDAGKALQEGRITKAQHKAIIDVLHAWDNLNANIGYVTDQAKGLYDAGVNTVKNVKNEVTKSVQNNEVKSKNKPNPSNPYDRRNLPNPSIQSVSRGIDKSVKENRKALEEGKKNVDMTNPINNLVVNTTERGQGLIELANNPLQTGKDLVEGVKYVYNNPEVIPQVINNWIQSDDRDVLVPLDIGLVAAGVADVAANAPNILRSTNQLIKPKTTSNQIITPQVKTNPNAVKVYNYKAKKLPYTEITPEQALQELQPEASLNEALNQAENYANIKNAVDSIEVPEPNYLVDMNKVNVPKVSNSSVYEYLSEYAPEVFTAKDYAPYATSEIIESYAKAMGIPKEQAIQRFKAQSGLSRYLDNAAGRTYLNDGNASVDILHPDEWVWGRNLRGATYEGTDELPTLTSTVNHEFAHKKLLDLYDQLEKGTITQEGYNELINLNALTQKGAYTESIPHAVDSIPIEGDISIPEGRVQKYNQIQPYSEFSNEAFKDYRKSFGKTLQQRAIRNAVGLGDKEFEKSVDSVLNRLGVDRYGNLNWGNK